jgi:peptide/nickel transport system permease protein
VAPHDPLEVDISRRLMPPVLFGGDWSYPLGTDANGRDILSRLIYGARVDIPVALISLAIGAIIGTVLGVVAGYLGGATESGIMRFTDLTLAFPMILLALLLAVALGPSASNVIVAVSVVLWARFARVVRGEVLSLKTRDFVALAVVAGASRTRIIRRHLLPNVASTVFVLASLQVGWVILVEAALSFLGAGVPPPTASWGSMVSEGRDYIATEWWVATIPGMVIMLAVLAFNLLGDWIRDRLDPKLAEL